MVATHDSLEVDETQALAYIVADEDEVWPQKPPILRTRRIIEFQSILPFPK